MISLADNTETGLGKGRLWSERLLSDCEDKDQWKKIQYLEESKSTGLYSGLVMNTEGDTYVKKDKQKEYIVA